LLGLLGPFQVADVDRDALGGPRQQSLLAILALSPNIAVSRERLIDLA
jgi:DNA-binding SARP family transcriptional activator